MKNAEWINLATRVCKDAGIKADSVDIISTWEQTFTDSESLRHNAVFRISDQRILKIFGTEAQRNYNVERAALDSFSDEIPSPRIIASGTTEEGSPYIIMSEISGKTLEHQWDELTTSELHSIAGQIGSITKQLHNQRQDKLAAVELRFGGKSETIKKMQAERNAEIEKLPNFSLKQKDELLNFLNGEALTFLEVPAKFTHSDLSHAHIYVDTDLQYPSVSGIIDWGGAMLGPAEWDIAFHWLWTFSQDSGTMLECLRAYYQGVPTPDQFARRCFAAHLYTFSMREVWEYFTEPVDDSDSVLGILIKALFPQNVFGSPD
jgi:aminoglycoside phosphotransferase (APT) family kinase protein